MLIEKSFKDDQKNCCEHVVDFCLLCTSCVELNNQISEEIPEENPQNASMYQGLKQQSLPTSNSQRPEKRHFQEKILIRPNPSIYTNKNQYREYF